MKTHFLTICLALAAAHDGVPRERRWRRTAAPGRTWKPATERAN